MWGLRPCGGSPLTLPHALRSLSITGTGQRRDTASARVGSRCSEGGKVLLAPIFSPICARDLSIRGGNRDIEMKIKKTAKQRPAVKTRRKVKWLKVILGAVRWIGLAFSLIDKHWPKISESVRDLF